MHQNDKEGALWKAPLDQSYSQFVMMKKNKYISLGSFIILSFFTFYPYLKFDNESHTIVSLFKFFGQESMKKLVTTNGIETSNIDALRISIIWQVLAILVVWMLSLFKSILAMKGIGEKNIPKYIAFALSFSVFYLNGRGTGICELLSNTKMIIFPLFPFVCCILTWFFEILMNEIESRRNND